jgi:hypothetical protein
LNRRILLKDIQTFRVMAAAEPPPPHRANVENPRWWAPPDGVLIVYLDSQIPSADDYLMDLDYSIDSWMN